MDAQHGGKYWPVFETSPSSMVVVCVDGRGGERRPPAAQRTCQRRERQRQLEEAPPSRCDAGDLRFRVPVGLDPDADGQLSRRHVLPHPRPLSPGGEAFGHL
jgi:hypothetical protein